MASGCQANDARRDADPAFKAESEVDLLLGGANPNPTREGCPPREALIALARRQVPVGDPVGDHVMKCSPCYREMRAIQQTEGVHPAAPVSTSRAWWPAAAAAAVILAAGIGGWWAFSQRSSVPSQAAVAADVASVAVELDLRKYSVTRSDGQTGELPPLVLPRANVKLTLVLPVGAEAGEYQVRVLDTSGQVAATGAATAVIREFVTSLTIALDLRAIPDSAGRLEYRRDDDSWRRVAIELR